MFDSQASLDDYLAGPLAEAVTNHPALSNFSIKQFDILGNITKVTRGPV